MRRLLGLSPLVVTLAWGAPAAAQGLAPLPPIGPQAPGSPTAAQEAQHHETARRLDEAEREDSGRNFELFWVDAQAGGSYIDMAQFSSATFEIETSSAAGPSFSAGAGVRFVLFVAGARLRYHALSSFDMWQINGEAGLKLPIRSFDLLFAVHGGYSFVGRLGDAALAADPNVPVRSDAVSIRGLNAGAEVAVDYYFSPLFSVGVGVLGDALILNRPPVGLPADFASLPPAQQSAIQSDPLYEKSGTSVGLALTGGLRLGLHFGL